MQYQFVFPPEIYGSATFYQHAFQHHDSFKLLFFYLKIIGVMYLGPHSRTCEFSQTFKKDRSWGPKGFLELPESPDDTWRTAGPVQEEIINN